MSLINDMLRDLDQRTGGHTIRPTDIDDTVTVPPLRRRRWPPSWVLLLGVGAALLALATYLLQGWPGAGRATPDPAELAAQGQAPAAPANHSTAPKPPPQAAPAPRPSPAPEPGPVAQAATEPPPAAPESTAGSATEPTAAQPAAAPDHPPATPTPAPESTAATEPAAADLPSQVHILPGKRANLRSGPGQEHPVLHVLSSRNSFTVLARDRDYFQVRSANGTTGWISAALLVPGPAPADAAAAPAAPGTPTPSPLATSPQTTSPAPPPAGPDNADLWLRRAIASLESGDRDQAERQLRRALDIDPRHRAALDTLAALLLRLQRRDDLEALLGALTQRAHPAPHAASLLARLRAERGDTAGGADALQALPLESLDGEQLAVLATLQQRLGRHGAAAANYRRALAAGQSGAPLWAALAVSLEAQGHSSEARSAWESTLASTPLDPTLARHARERLQALSRLGD